MQFFFTTDSLVINQTKKNMKNQSRRTAERTGFYQWKHRSGSRSKKGAFSREARETVQKNEQENSTVQK